MPIFESLTFDTFDAVEFNCFDLYDAFDEYPASYYGEDVLASTVGQCLSFLTILPRDDGVFSSFDAMQTLGLYRGIAAPDIPIMHSSFMFMLPNNKPHFHFAGGRSHNVPYFIIANSKPHFRMTR